MFCDFTPCVSLRMVEHLTDNSNLDLRNCCFRQSVKAIHFIKGEFLLFFNVGMTIFQTVAD